MVLIVFKSLVLFLKNYKTEMQDAGLIQESILIFPQVHKLLNF